MCLNTKQKKPLKATEDIVCYKTFGMLGNSTPTKIFKYALVGKDIVQVPSGTRTFSLQSRHQNFKYVVGKSYKTTFNKYDIGTTTINKGFHAFVGRPSTIARREGRQLFECIVPKGTRYFLGSNNGESNGICAEAIRIVKPI